MEYEVNADFIAGLFEGASDNDGVQGLPRLPQLGRAARHIEEPWSADPVYQIFDDKRAGLSFDPMSYLPFEMKPIAWRS